MYVAANRSLAVLVCDVVGCDIEEKHRWYSGCTPHQVSALSPAPGLVPSYQKKLEETFTEVLDHGVRLVLPRETASAPNSIQYRKSSTINCFHNAQSTSEKVSSSLIATCC